MKCAMHDRNMVSMLLLKSSQLFAFSHCLRPEINISRIKQQGQLSKNEDKAIGTAPGSEIDFVPQIGKIHLTNHLCPTL